MIKRNGLRRARKNLQGRAPLFLLALVASCGNDTTGPLEEVTPLLMVDGDMGAQFQSLTVTREGVAVTDGTVTVNGVAIPHAGAGLYQGQLPTTLPAGSPLNLQVSVRGATVHGTVNVPEAPVLTAPATGTVFDPRDTITVSWTSATNPDRFVVSGAFITLDVVRSDMTFPAAGTARELKIPLPPEVGAGPGTTLSVFACNDGSIAGQVDPDSRMSICAQSPPNADISTAASPLRILGGVGAQSQNIRIFQGGWELTDGVGDAVVTVNGVTVPHTALSGYYRGELSAAVPPGSPLDLRVSVRGLNVEATGNVPEAPVLTGAVFAPSGSITVSWTSATDPDRFEVYVNTNGPVWHGELPGAARELEIAASELPAGPELTIHVIAYDDGLFSGPAHPDSRMGITAIGVPSAVIAVIR